MHHAVGRDIHMSNTCHTWNRFVVTEEEFTAVGCAADTGSSTLGIFGVLPCLLYSKRCLRNRPVYILDDDWVAA